MVKIIVLVILAEIFMAVGHLLFKKGTNTIEAYSLRGVDAHRRFLKDVLVQPGIWIGFFAMAAGLVIWLAALAQGDLSLVFPMGSLQYLIILFSAHFFLGEKIDRMKLAGTFCVVIGIIFITMS